MSGQAVVWAGEAHFEGMKPVHRLILLRMGDWVGFDRICRTDWDDLAEAVCCTRPEFERALAELQIAGLVTVDFEGESHTGERETHVILHYTDEY